VRLARAARGAAAVHGCAAPPLPRWTRLWPALTASLCTAAEESGAVLAAPPLPRWTRLWPALTASLCTAAEESGAVLVMLGNLYGYGPVTGPMTEDLPLAATGPKGRVRAAAWEQARALHEAGRIRAVEVRASDFFGPGVTDGGHLAARVMPNLLKGRPVATLGDPDTPHSWTYLPDVARAMAELAGEERAWGRAWHVPTAAPLSVRAMAGRLAAEAGGGPVAVRRLPAPLLAVAGLVNPLLRELREVRYQFDRPFTVDCSAYEAAFTVRATPLEEQLRATVAWWRERA
ncbi:NAD-dependent epimerase/dehydratase family protein, partial [Streptomyces sp. CBMA156]|uniref:NAD-dependent epimerase/dehydratase family protein n=1 Tax=Streptomyces sp. CBMA156 TaxID=1930280 RepID=UPI0039832793